MTLDVRKARLSDVNAIAVLANADRLAGLPPCLPSDVADAMSGRSGVDAWFWNRLVGITTLVACHRGRICGAASVALGATEMDGAAPGDRWLLWAHAREDADTLDVLFDRVLRVGEADKQLHAFAFASPLAIGLEGLPVTRRPVTDERLRSLGVRRRFQWTMMHATARTLAPALAWHAEPGETKGSVRVQLDVDGRPVGEAEASMLSTTHGVLWWLFIPEEQRGRGLGRALLRASRRVIEDQGAREVLLFVDDDDPIRRDRRPAKALYAAEGFEVVDRLASYDGVPRPRLEATRLVQRGSTRRHDSPVRRMPSIEHRSTGDGRAAGDTERHPILSTADGSGVNEEVAMEKWQQPADDPAVGAKRLRTVVKWIGLIVGSFALAACGHATTAQSNNAVTSPTTGAARLCSSAFPAHYLNAASGTVADVRSLTVGPGYKPGKNAFVGEADSRTVAWCWTGGPGDYTLYAVVQGHPPLKIEGMSGPRATHTPAPGPGAIP